MSKGIYKKWLEPVNLALLEGWKRNGLTDQQIADNVGINVRTLDKWKVQHGQIRQALKIGHEHANLIVERELFQKAASGNTTAMIFWLKNNWRDKYNDSQLSKEERKLVVERGKKLEAETELTKLKVKALKDGDKSTEEAVDKLMDVLEGTVKDEHKSE
ncbi:small terminase subunit [Limosilactobacillus coleohominis DSM 14060]|nr:small terminase subunit [Limosilactobacillus coleohominis DSM 14060]